jgi:hexosaminidase
MKVTSLTIALLIIAQLGFAQFSIIPAPVEMKAGLGKFTLKSGASVQYSKGNEGLKNVADMLSAQLKLATGYAIPVVSLGAKTGLGNIILSINQKPVAELGAEGYLLNVTAAQITISANAPAGIFYGVQTVMQLFPPAISGRAVSLTTKEWKVPAGTIKDYPRFGWRGLMFDVSRHFFTTAEVKRFIDDMVKYKYNLLHLHLTDDQGWRIEIKSLPKLTEVGAWNVKRSGWFGSFAPPDSTEPRNYGGFFTHDDIKDIVQYAKDHFVNVMPEIDVPGHSLAALASYPNLASIPGNFKVNSGEKLMEWPANGHFYGLIDNSLCPANEEVYVFLDKVFTEVAQLFPFEYIHMGGDETARNFWDKSEAIKQLMAREHLKNLDEVQSYFVKRVSAIVQSKGKKLIGWDEILEGGLAPGAAVMSWRGEKGGIEAAKMGHEVVMSPNNYVYIDLMQGDAFVEPKVYSSIRLKKTYSFEPIPEGVPASMGKGGQANLWTEQIYNMRQAQYMTWPRGLAVAEVVWSPKAKHNWNDFIQRVETEFVRMDAAEIKYAPSMYEPDFKVIKDGADGLKIALETEIEDISLHYSFDNSYPDNFYPKYTGVISVPRDAILFRVISYRNGKQVGRIITVPVADLRKKGK